jgi:hypothetical protein
MYDTLLESKSIEIPDKPKIPDINTDVKIPSTSQMNTPTLEGDVPGDDNSPGQDPSLVVKNDDEKRKLEELKKTIHENRKKEAAKGDTKSVNIQVQEGWFGKKKETDKQEKKPFISENDITKYPEDIQNAWNLILNEYIKQAKLLKWGVTDDYSPYVTTSNHVSPHIDDETVFQIISLDKEDFAGTVKDVQRLMDTNDRYSDDNAQDIFDDMQQLVVLYLPAIVINAENAIKDRIPSFITMDWLGDGDEGHMGFKIKDEATRQRIANHLSGGSGISEADSVITDPESLPNPRGDEIPTQEAVLDVINKSPNLLMALEALAPMYGIDPDDILCDDSLQSIQVQECGMVASSAIPAKGNDQAIMRAIGLVLDAISKRVDDKLNERTTTLVNPQPAFVAKPEWGSHVKTVQSPDGGNVSAYSSGYIFVEDPNSKVALETADALREELQLGAYAGKQQESYFGEDEDVTQGVAQLMANNLNLGADPYSGGSKVDSDINTVASEIGESTKVVEFCEYFRHTRQLGYDLLQHQGFDYIRSTAEEDSVIQEAAETKAKKASKGKKKKEILSSEISHMRFDNSQIVKSIKLMNQVFKDLGENVQKIDVKQFVNSPKYKEAIQALNKQFDASINIHYFTNQYDNEAFCTMTGLNSDISRNISVSKSKGFQLNGMPLAIAIGQKSLLDVTSGKRDPRFFGQTFVAILLHEIFHNVAMAFKVKNGEFATAFGSTMNLALVTNDAKKKRELITRFVNTLERFGDMKMNFVTKRMVIRQMMLATSIAKNQKAMTQIESKLAGDEKMPEHEIDTLIRHYRQLQKSGKSSVSGVTTGKLVLGILFAIPTLGASLVWLWVLSETKTQFDSYKQTRQFEEHYSDMFAAMYKLPTILFTYSAVSGKSYTANEIDTDKLRELNNLQRDVREMWFAIHPTDTERQHSAVKVAEKLLASKTKLDPSIKDYCEWIVNNFSSVKELGIDEEGGHSSHIFDPTSADNLDKVTQTIIDKNDVALTEADLSHLFKTFE